MADKPKDTYQAAIDNLQLEIETIDDTIEKAIVRHEFPYRDGAMLDDLGQKARVIRIRCYWYGETYETHKEFLKHLDKKDRFELTHPKYGLMKGSIESVSIRHDDREQTAEIDLSFIQGLIESPTVTRQVNIERSAEDGFITGQDELMDDFNGTAIEELGPDALSITTATINPAQGLADQFSGLTTTVRSWVKDADSYIRSMTGILPSITNPADSLTAMITYPSTIAGTVVGAVARAMERYAVLYEALRTAPGRYMVSLSGSLDTLVAASGRFTRTSRIASAQRQALKLSYLYGTDETRRTTVKRLEEAKSFDALGRYIKPEEPEAIMTIDEIETVLADVRTDIQAAIDVSRGMQSLKTMAAALVDHANEIKLERDKIITIETDNILPLHLICLANGLSYNYAQRILAISHIRHPSFVPPGEVKIYAR